VDNQWVVYSLYHGVGSNARSSKDVVLALQEAAYSTGLGVLSCMSMVSECYSNYILSNVIRISMGYIPSWKLDAKLRLLFIIYNSLFYLRISYLGFGMFAGYDPCSLAHSVARIPSGNPIYITDRDHMRSNTDLLKRPVLPDGEAVMPNESGQPTRGIVCENP